MKTSLNSKLKKIEKAGESLSGVKVSNDPKRAEIEKRLFAAGEKVKKEGLQ